MHLLSNTCWTECELLAKTAVNKIIRNLSYTVYMSFCPLPTTSSDFFIFSFKSHGAAYNRCKIVADVPSTLKKTLAFGVLATHFLNSLIYMSFLSKLFIHNYAKIFLNAHSS